MSGGDITSEEHEVVLREEEAVVSKRVVPKERVRLDKDVVTEQREVGGEVRKEQIEFEEGQERQ
jgi:stress response protein YsnF